MSTVPLEQLQDSLQEKRTSLTNWLNTAPPPRKRTLLGPMNEQAVRTHLDVLDATLEKDFVENVGRLLGLPRND